MSQFGPTRGELIFRFCFSLFGLALLIAGILFRGIGGIAAFEIVGIAGVFFGGTAGWTAWKLLKARHEQD